MLGIGENVTHILNNIAVFEKYQKSNNPDEKKFFIDHLKKGMNFIAVKIGEKYSFAPSRFVGYIDNDIMKHEDNPYKHGFDTDARIQEILKSKQKPNDSIENAFLELCKEFGITPDNREREYWIIELPNLDWFG